MANILGQTNKASSAGILITGGAGMLARALVPVFQANGHQLVITDIDLCEQRPWGEAGPVLRELDVRRGRQVAAAIDRTAPSVLLHLAAETDLERCEDDPEHAMATNAEATRTVAECCRRAGVKMVYVSTAGVFDGEQERAYVESDPARPINWYGRSKAAGEDIVRATIEDHLIVRAGWMVGGPGLKDHKFIGHMISQIRAGCTEINAVGDKFGSPTYAPDFATTLIALLRSNAPASIYHSVSECSRSRYQVAGEIVRLLGREDILVREVGSDFFSESYYAPRPRSEVLLNANLRAIGQNHMRPWPAPLIECLAPWLPALGGAVNARPA